MLARAKSADPEIQSRNLVGPEIWNALVQSSPDGWCFGLYGWQELILAVAPWGLQDHSFALRENGRFVAVVPLQFNPNNGSMASSGWGGAGPILVGDLSGKSRRRIMDRALSHCVEISRECGATAFEISLTPVSETSLNAGWGVNPLALHGMEDVSDLSQVIDLGASEEDLWQGLSPDARRQVRLAREAGYSVDRADWAQSLEHYYALHCDTYGRTGVPSHPREYFSGIAHHMAPQGHAVLWQVRDGSGEIVGYHNDACFRNAAYYHTGCSATGSGASGAGYLLFWEAIIGARKAGIRWYDCGAVFPNAEDGKQRGLTMFKTKFGGEPHRLFRGRIALNEPTVTFGGDVNGAAPPLDGSSSTMNPFWPRLSRLVKAFLRAGQSGLALVLGDEMARRVGDGVWRGIHAAASMRARTMEAVRRTRRGSWSKIPFIRPYWDRSELAVGRMENADRPGDRKRFELKLREVVGIPDSDAVVLTGSGRSALELVLRTLLEQYPERTKVLLPSFGCRGIYDPIIAVGLQPVFVEIDSDLLPSEQDMIAHMDDTVLACLAVNTCGKQMRLGDVIATAHRLGIHVIEDDCHALGKAPSGYSPDFRLLSFGMGKNAMASAGGALVASSHQADVLRRASMLGEEPPESSLGRFEYQTSRYCRTRSRSVPSLDSKYLTQYSNVRMSPRDARLMLAQLEKLSDIVAKRQSNATRFRSALMARPDIFKMQSSDLNTYTKFTVVLPSKELAWGFRSHLAGWGVETEEMYFPLHERSFAELYRDRDLPGTERLKYCVVNVPIRPNLTQREVKAICQSIDNFCEVSHGR